MKRIAVLGSTGSIGINTLSVIRQHPRQFRAVGLTTNARVGLLRRQVDEFKPRFMCVADSTAASRIKGVLSKRIKLFVGDEGILELIRQKEVDSVVLAISQAAALKPFLQCIESRKEVALANKEALVMAGPLLMERAGAAGVNVLPIDSEQSAIWQCFIGEDKRSLKKIYLTASGGPLLRVPPGRLRNISREAVLKHPRWNMGPKITVDSATLMNKGLEFLETMALFGVKPQQIEVLIHPESIIHSMVEFRDGVIKAQLSQTDMRIPIQYALSYPQRLSNGLPSVNFFKVEAFHFEKPDIKKFPCLASAYRAARDGGTLPAVLNAANEVAVEAFLSRRIRFERISRVIAGVCDRHRLIRHPSLDEIIQADTWARREAARFLEPKRLMASWPCKERGQ